MRDHDPMRQLNEGHGMKVTERNLEGLAEVSGLAPVRTQKQGSHDYLPPVGKLTWHVWAEGGGFICGETYRSDSQYPKRVPAKVANRCEVCFNGARDRKWDTVEMVERAEQFLKDN